MKSGQIKDAAEMWAHGFNTKEIAMTVGVNRDTLWFYMRHHRDIFPHRNHHADWWRERLREVAGENASVAARMLGTSDTTVSHWRARLGID